MFRVRGDEHQRRCLGQALQALGQRQAILAGHVDVQQQQINRLATRGLQQRQRLGGVRGFLHVQAQARLLGLAVGQQGAQALACQGFVVHQKNVHGQVCQGEQGRAMRTW